MEYMDLLPPTAPSLVFARETCRPIVMFPQTAQCIVTLRRHVNFNYVNDRRIRNVMIGNPFLLY